MPVAPNKTRFMRRNMRLVPPLRNREGTPQLQRVLYKRPNPRLPMKTLAILCAAVSTVQAAVPTSRPHVPTTSVAVFAGGCFWGVEGVFEHVRGVLSATAGYAGGTVPSPTYEMVSSGTTGHAESVRVVYDPGQVTYDQLLEVFFTVAHNPTERDRQGPDVGTQYRSIVFYQDSTQRRAAE